MHPIEMTTASNWVPILPQNDRMTAVAWDAVNAIAADIENRTYPAPQNKRVSYRAYEESIFYGYLALVKGNRWWDVAAQCLNTSIERVSLLRHPGLFGGLCGLGWTVQHLSNVFQNDSPTGDGGNAVGDEDEEEDLTADIDAALITQLREWHPADRPYDLVGGLVGFGIYFLERLPRRAAVVGIRWVLDYLEEISQRQDGGITWHTSSQLLTDWQRERCPGGYYNMGVAHGIPGILFLLGEMSAAGVEQERAIQMLESAMDWFLAQRCPPEFRSWFTSWIPTPGQVSESRLAWCYGDLGILAVLFQVARRTGRKEWQDFADTLLEHCLARPVEASGVLDAPLCHGASGNAHIFNRLYQATRNSKCREAAIRWLEVVLTMRKPGSGVGGFFQYTRPDPQGPPVWEASPAFLDGAVGVALALLAAITPLEPRWDRMLLLSGRSWNGNWAKS